jgi:hypothetical protein
MTTTATPKASKKRAPKLPALDGKPVTHKPESAKKPDKKIEMLHRCTFTNTEMIELGKRAAELNNQMHLQETELKDVTTQLKAKCKSTEAKLSETFGKMTVGYEYRNVLCVVRYDKPVIGKKTITRMDTLETVEISEMTLSETQGELPLAPISDTRPLAPVIELHSPPLATPVLPADVKIPVTPGTVEVAADGGSRDDAGPENKNG